jgi:hypothetical protein
MKFKEGDILEVVDATGLSVEKGETATCHGCTTDQDGYVWVQVIWNKIKSYHNQNDGGYFEYHFEKIGELKDLKKDRIFEENKEKAMEFNFEEGKQRIIKLLENHIEDFTHDMMQDIRGVVNGDREEILDPIEDIIHFTRKRNKLIESSISKLYVASSVFEVLEAVEDTIFEDMEMEILTELFGLKEVIKRK